MTDGIAFHTPDFDGNAPLVFKWLALPSFLWHLFNGAFGELMEERNYTQYGDMPIEDVVQAFMDAEYNMDETTMYVNQIAIIGSIVPFALETLPAGVLPCDGSTHPRCAYPRLYEVIAPQYIVDADNFKVPDLRGRTPMAAGDGAGLTPRALGDVGGEESHLLTPSELPTHNHEFLAFSGDPDIEAPEPDCSLAKGDSVNIYSSSDAPDTAMNSASIGNAGGNQPHENMPPFYALNYGIVAR